MYFSPRANYSTENTEAEGAVATHEIDKEEFGEEWEPSVCTGQALCSEVEDAPHAEDVEHGSIPGKMGMTDSDDK